MDARRYIKIRGANENNLKNIDVRFPLGVMTCVTGVSGSGKSSLVNEILYKRLARDLNHARTIPGKHRDIEGLEALDKVKQANKAEFAAHLKKTTGQIIDPNSIFCCQVKRMHEYKRQHQNAMNIAS